MKKFISLILLGLLSLMPTANAGDKGNIFDILRPIGFYGGDAVVCRNPDKTIISAHLLDYAERDEYFPDSLFKYEPNYTDLEFVNKMADTLEHVAPDVFFPFRKEAMKLATYLLGYASDYKISPDVIFYHDRRLLDLDDLGKIEYVVDTNKEGCKVEQLVIRHKQFSRNVYYVQADILSHLSSRDKRGLVLHEALYQTFNLSYGDFDSARTRYFNRLLMSQKSQ